MKKRLEEVCVRYGQVSVHITSDVFRRVATALANDRLHVVEGRHDSNMITYSAWASGNDAANTFYLGSNQRWSRDFNALVVHESIHAYFDLSRTEIPWVDNEAVAYISQGFYLRNSGFPESRIEFGSHFRVGYLIAGILAQGDTAPDMIAGLRSNLLSDSNYSHYITSTFRGDG